MSLSKQEVNNSIILAAWYFSCKITIRSTTCTQFFHL